MNPEDLIEGKDFTEVKIQPAQNNAGGLGDVLDEEVEKPVHVESAKINEDDFTSDFTEIPPVKEEEKIKPEKKVEKKEDPAVVHDKNAAAARLFKPEVVLNTFNAITGRIGKVINKKNPDCLRF